MTPKPPKLRTRETLMTIGIGLLASSKPRPHVPRPDTVILLADTMGSTETDSTDELHKIFWDASRKLHATCAGSVAMCAELFSMFQCNFDGLSRRTHGTMFEALNVAVHGHRTQHFTWDLLAPKYSFLRPDDNGRIPIPTSQESAIVREWQEYDTGAQMMVGAFDETGQSFLYFIGRCYGENGPAPGLVHVCPFPGHWAIGTGDTNAESWLNYREHTLGRNVRQSAYHAYEAKIMASKAPTVNHRLEMVIATAEQSWLLTNEEPEVAGCEVSLLELATMFKKYGPQDTTTLGHPSKPSTSQKLGDQQ